MQYYGNIICGCGSTKCLLEIKDNNIILFKDSKWMGSGQKYYCYKGIINEIEYSEKIFDLIKNNIYTYNNGTKEELEKDNFVLSKTNLENYDYTYNKLNEKYKERALIFFKNILNESKFYNFKIKKVDINSNKDFIKYLEDTKKLIDKNNKITFSIQELIKSINDSKEEYIDDELGNFDNYCNEDEQEYNGTIIIFPQIVKEAFSPNYDQDDQNAYADLYHFGFPNVGNLSSNPKENNLKYFIHNPLYKQFKLI